MIIKSLCLKNFRNFETLDIQFSERLNIIVGNNGQGKTNILEAIFLLTEGQSFRYSKLENLIKIHQEHSLVSAEVINNSLDYKMQLRLTDKSRQRTINNKIAKPEFMNRFSAVLFSPESLNVIKQSSDERRLLTDQLIAQIIINGYNVILNYRKILKNRNRLLKDISEEKISMTMGKDILDSLNESFLKLSVELTQMRLQALNSIREYVEESLQKIEGSVNGQWLPKFEFQYLFSNHNHMKSGPEQIQDFMKKRMSELATAEVKSGVSLIGPHRHDIAFLYNGNDSRFYCSQGQQRSIILAYKMAQIVYHHKVHGFYPLLLLDDVLSELDLSKQESLISTLNQTETQTFVTTTDVTLLPKLSMNKASVFTVKNGIIA